MVHQPNSDWKCSLERLDTKIGYLAGNVALVCHEFNGPSQWNKNMIVNLPDLIYQDVNYNELHRNVSMSITIESKEEIYFVSNANWSIHHRSHNYNSYIRYGKIWSNDQ